MAGTSVDVVAETNAEIEQEEGEGSVVVIEKGGIVVEKKKYPPKPTANTSD